jgi:hypothetical protein
MDQSSQSITKVPSLIRVLCATHLGRALALLLFVCACFAFWGAVQPSSLNKIQRENLQPGTQLTNPADNRQIEGYASLTSVPVGGDIDLFVNTQDATYTLTVFRMGWYGGKGGRKVLGPQMLPGIRQPIPTGDPRTELIECNWTSPFHIHVPASWVSGIYLAKLHGKTSGKESYIIFCVRDSRRADLVFQQSVTTYQAYNGWLGQSLYTFNTAGETQVDRVSFNRPYAAGNPGQGAGAGDFLGTIAPVAIEYSMVRWLEREGYDVTYITNVDTHEAVGRLLRGKGFLSVGHDEYWSHNTKAHIIQARDHGVGLGFFSANYAFWPIDLEPSFDGKDWNHWYETSVVGHQPDPDVCREGSRAGMTCTTDNTDATTGCPGASPAPGDGPHYCFPYCNRTPFPYYSNPRQDWAMTVYQASSGAWVFNGATNDWTWGLDDYFTGLHTPDGANNGPALRTQCGYPFFHPDLVSCRSPAIEQITRNVLNKFINP